MKFSHNKPNSEPVINKVIETKHHFPFLEPNRLYLMPSMPEEVAVSINQTLTDMMDVNVKSANLFNDYTCIHLRNLPFSDNNILKTTILKEGCNVLLPLNSFNGNSCQFLMARIEENDVMNQVSQIIDSSEQSVKKYLFRQI